ncbi:polysaccharide biosynthesis/export family protein [Methylovulum miyakonense]|uniref:polysaccharide biosynthesis/export family protein n=1 Tax=Methylovulum miyakonense TaxID=645578 RepID=UPI0018DB0483|nr:polysaccharide biosynthesis/export family protein [Methylovulum miyakonense]
MARGRHLNPDYAVAVGDNIQVRFWGAFEYDAPLTVDPQGNIFVPHVGPLQVLGVRNQDLQRVVDSAVRRVSRPNVYSYASLAAAQPVRGVSSSAASSTAPGSTAAPAWTACCTTSTRPGRASTSNAAASRLQAQPVNRSTAPTQHPPATPPSSTRSVHCSITAALIVRSGLILGASSERRGRMVVNAPGRVERHRANAYEFNKRRRHRRRPRPARQTHGHRHPCARHPQHRQPSNVEYYPLADAARVPLRSGDTIEFTADKKQGTITVRVEGEHLSAQEYVVPYGTRLGTLMAKVRYNDRADKNSLQLFRQSIIARQKDMLDSTLKHLETSVLTARSGTQEEAQLRTEEAAMMLQWIDRAKSIQPSGQVLLAQADHIDRLLLENGDVIRIPAVDNLVLVSGEVMFPNTVALAADKDIEDYIATAGGYSQRADTSRIVIAHRDGSFEDTEASSGWFSEPDIRPGDEIMVLPAVDPKYRQVFKEFATMIYQMGLGARVFLK